MIDTLPFNEAVSSRGSGSKGLAQSEWTPEGRYPVIGQGAGYVEGRTDREDLLINPEPAVVLYGGHTRRAKLVTEPFVPGPNVKILTPGPKVDAAYLYRFLEQLKIESRGYADHFRDVKRSDIPVPPLSEQKRIAAILDAAYALRAKRRASIDQLDALMHSIFLDMFGDPVENPKSLQKTKLRSVFTFRTGKLDSNAAVDGGKYPFFTCARETLQIDNYAFDCEALLLAGNNANADYSVKHYQGKFNAYQRTYVISLDERKLLYPYARFVLEHLLGDLKRFSKGTNTKYLTKSILDRMPILVPSLESQRRFSVITESVERHKIRMRAHLNKLDTLFACLQSRAFRGEL